jgi:hypothetical protein
LKPKQHFERALHELAPNEPRPTTSTRSPRRPASTSGQLSLRHARLREALTRYLSPILVDSVMQRALEARGGRAAGLADPALAELTADIMLGLRLFVPEERLADLMLELAEILDANDAG